jgi:hypothetical protein
MGHYHWGVVHALLHEDLLPNIISGTSAGAVVASFICTRYPPFRRVSPCVSCRACAVCRVPCAVCRVPCAVCRVPCAVCRVPCAVCRVPCVSLTYDIAGRTKS